MGYPLQAASLQATSLIATVLIYGPLMATPLQATARYVGPPCAAQVTIWELRSIGCLLQLLLPVEALTAALRSVYAVLT